MVDFSKDRLLLHLERNLLQRCGVAPQSRLLLAVSGGGDSAALLELVSALAPRLDLHVEVAHFDHALRPESATDARFVVAESATRGFRCHVGRWDKPRPGEAAARAARYSFLVSTAKERSCDAVVLAHHLDDRTETLLLQLSRGTGLRGLGGMGWRRRVGGVALVRPLLDVPRGVLREFLASCMVTWREDSTNNDPAWARNRLRHGAIPALEATLRPGWRQRWGEALEDLRQAAALVDELAARVITAARMETGTALDLDVLRSAPRLVQATALQRWLLRNGVASPERQITRRHLRQIHRIVQDARTGRSVSLPGGWILHLDRGRLSLVNAVSEESADAQDACLGGLDLEASDVPREAALAALSTREERSDLSRRWLAPPQNGTTLLSGDGIIGPLDLRTALPGDRVRLLGAPGTRRLCRILRDRWVPRRFRAFWPVVSDPLGIVWVPGIGIAERGRIGSETRRVLELRLYPKKERPGAGLAHVSPTLHAVKTERLAQASPPL
jgi:tRNA(Ile)-lysidine synthase